MTFKHKLSRRLAMLWSPWLTLTLAVACAKPITAPGSPPPPPPPGAGEPVYNPATARLIWQDNMDEYVSAIDMYNRCVAAGHGQTYAGWTPSGCVQGLPYDPADQLIAPGRGGTGKAIRVAYQGNLQESHNMWLWGIPQGDPTKPLYIQHWFRLILTAPVNWALDVKWIEIWHVNSATAVRLQFNTHYNMYSGVTLGTRTLWQVYDGNTTTAHNAQQPVRPPWFDTLGTDGGQWHRVTYAYLPQSVAGARDGYARMWIDGRKMIDVSQATVGVVPTGASYPWCDQADVDAIFTAQPSGGIGSVSFAGPLTTTTSPWTLDWDDFLMWQ